MKRKRPITWLDNFERGQYSTELLSLTLTTPRGVCHGQGFLDWKKRSGTRIRAITDGGQHFGLSSSDGTQTGIGRLLKANQYSTLKAITQAGQPVYIERLLAYPQRVSNGNPSVVWDIRQTQILSAIGIGTVKEEADDTRTDLLLTNATRMIWPRRFPESLTFESHRGTVLAWKKDHLAKVTIRHTGKCKLSATLRGLIATFSFWSGSVVNITAFEHSSGDDKGRRILSPMPSLPQVAPPLGFGTDLELNLAHEVLLAKSLDFFSDEGNEEFCRLASTFLASQRNAFSANALISCTCLERLAKLVAPQQDRSKPIPDEQISRAQQCLVDAGVGNELVNRFSKFAGTANAIGGANAIHEWCRTGFLGFTKSDGTAFTGLRNPTAHGSLNLFGEDDDSKQESVSKRDRINNMLNKLVLYAIGYQGPYFDYGQMVVMEFPAPPNQPGSVT